MPFNGSGLFSRVFNWVDDRDNDRDISASRMDQEMDGFATGLSTALLKDGTQAATALIPFAKGINVAASAPASPANGDMWLTSDGLMVRMNGISVCVLPIGSEMPWGNATPPTGWLMMYGQNVSRTTYAKLFSVYGTTYGAGDGSTTFALPDYRGRAPFGKDNMGGSAASRITSATSGVDGSTLGAVGGDQRLHQHSHGVTDPGHVHNTIMITSTSPGNPLSGYLTGSSGLWTSYQATFSATTGISIQNGGAGSSQNMPPAIIRNWIVFAGA